MSESRSRRFLKNTGIYAVGNITRQLTGFIMLPIYTRYLVPADYGVLGILIFSLSLVELVFGARLLQALPKFYHAAEGEQSKKRFISTAWIVTIAFSSFFAAILMTKSTPISNFLFDTDVYSAAVAIYCINLATMGAESYGLMYLRIMEKPVLFVVSGILKLALQLSLNIYFVIYSEMGVFGVVLGSVISSFVFAVLLNVYMLLNTGLGFSRSAAIELLSFSWPLWLASFAGLYIGSSDRIFLKEFASLEAVGLLYLAQKFATILDSIVWRPVGLYWQVERFKYYKAGEAAPSVYRTVNKAICLVLVCAAVGIALLSKPVILFMAAAEYHVAHLAVVWLVYASFFNCMTNYLNFSFNVTANTIVIRNNSFLTALLITVLYFAIIPTGGYIGAAIAYLLARFGQFLITYRKSRQIYDLNIDIDFLLRVSLLSLLACFACDYVEIHSLVLETTFRLTVFLSTLLILYWISRRDEALNAIISDLLKVKRR